MEDETFNSGNCSRFVGSSAASAEPITSFTLFGGNSANIGSTVTNTNGFLGSNGNVILGNGSDTITVQGGGILNGGSTLDILSAGNITFNGNVILGNGSHATGNVNSGGTVNIGSTAQVDGNVVAGGQVIIGNGSKVLGNVDAGFAGPGIAVDLGTTAQVVGTVTHKAGTTVNVPASSSIGANVIGTPALPTAYVPTVLPTGTVFASGGANVGAGENGQLRVLAPGSYNNINFGSTNTVKLTSGDYFFNNFTLGNGSIFDITFVGPDNSNDVRIFITGFANIGSTITFALGAGGDASDIYTEAMGVFILGNGSQWRGTVYDTGGTADGGCDLNAGSTINLVGAFIAKNDLCLGNGSSASLVTADYLAPPATPSNDIPAPSAMLLLATGLFGLALRRRVQS